MIYIIGAGAIGKALAVMLAKAGMQVQLVRGSVDGQPQMIENITVHLPDESLISADVTVTTFHGLADISGTVLVTSKSYGNQHIAGRLAAIGTHGPVILLQNGLGIEQPFIEHGLDQLYRCVLMATSQFETNGRIRFKPVTASPIGAVNGSDLALDAIVAQIANPWFPFRTEKSILPVVWKKVIANCVFNSICPLLDTDNGIFYRNTEVMAWARNIITECVRVAAKAGVALACEDIERLVSDISRSSDGQLISTLQDIRNGRETEIATLNLAVARQAANLQVPQLATTTRLLGELVQLKSQIKL